MMLFWALAAVATAGVVGLLVRPLLRAGGGDADRLAYDLAVYRDQLAEVERARAAGELGEEEAAGSRLEIERRILTAEVWYPGVAAANPPPDGLGRGLGAHAVRAAIAGRDLSHKGSRLRQDDYIERTVKKALAYLEG